MGVNPSGLHVVGPDESRPPRRPRPGPAVVAILAYAAIFMGALWLLKSRSVPRTPAASLRAPARPYEEGGSARKRSDPLTRAALISGEHLTPAARDEYFRQLSAECCTCGCDLNLRDCLVSDQSCSRSPGLAEKILDRLR